MCVARLQECSCCSSAPAKAIDLAHFVPGVTTIYDLFPPSRFPTLRHVLARGDPLVVHAHVNKDPPTNPDLITVAWRAYS